MDPFHIKLLINGQWKFWAAFSTRAEAQTYLKDNDFPACNDIGIFEDDDLVELDM